MKYFSEKTVKEMLVDFARTDTFPIREDYPHIEIPNVHGRLIDADELEAGEAIDLGKEAWDIVHNAPTVLEASDGE